MTSYVTTNLIKEVGKPEDLTGSFNFQYWSSYFVMCELKYKDKRNVALAVAHTNKKKIIVIFRYFLTREDQVAKCCNSLLSLERVLSCVNTFRSELNQLS